MATPFDQLIAVGQQANNPLANTGKPDFTGLLQASVNTGPSYGQTSIDYSDPNYFPSLYGKKTGGSSSRSTGSTAVSAVNPQAVDQINRLIGSNDTQLQGGLTGINDSYNLASSRLNQQQSNALSGYATQRQDTNNDEQTALNQIGQNARQSYNGLQSLLGLAGAGVSSAAQTLAPYAVGLQASQQRGNTVNTYGRNLRDLQTAEDQTNQSYQNSLADLLSQKNDQTKSLYNNYYSNKQSLLNQLGAANGGNYDTNQINAAQSAMDQLFSQYRNPQYNITPVSVSTPQLSNYTNDPIALSAQQQAGQGGVNNAGLSYLPELLKQNQNYNVYTG